MKTCVKKILCAGILFFTLCAFASAQERGLQVLARELDRNAAVGTQWAVFIAVDRYREWAPLTNPVKDAREIRDILTENYFIDEVRELYDLDATAANIRRLFSYLLQNVQMNDSVFVFYAGHGHTDNLTNTGFWIPTDGGRDEMAQANWLPNMQIRNLLSALKARHVFLIVDACFSGDILDTSRGASPVINNEYFRRAYGRVSRQVMTSGASENVPDASEFALRLKSSLRRAEISYVDPEYLFTNVREVRATQPLLGIIRGSEHQEGGSFIFFRRDAEPKPAVLPVPPAIVSPVAPLPPVQVPVTPAAPAVTPEAPRSGGGETGDGFAYSSFRSVGVSAGTAFSTPMGTAAVNVTVPFFIPYSFLDLGCDLGRFDTVNDSDSYTSYYPWARYNFFLPFLNSGIVPYIGAGAGYMMATYEYPGGTVTKNIFAFDAAAGLKLLGFIDISYSLRISSAAMSGRASLGVFYSFGN
jgi:hypothetical protein